MIVLLSNAAKSLPISEAIITLEGKYNAVLSFFLN